ncbi:hypothetical protein [Mycoplasmopsis gallinacea]|uniref:Uncharacterized protein n=1 Tax=Mycoplasmopsis gallinacea TaxID=29556 RepID=A0A6H0V7Q7_9BACT|nr:hypothetical protein [Mycoplasmopsis gallinacea]QIW62525.1 hypothetical protein GOQ20_03845 [Mycoplasmopsis gallinacea]
MGFINFLKKAFEKIKWIFAQTVKSTLKCFLNIQLNQEQYDLLKQVFEKHKKIFEPVQLPTPKPEKVETEEEQD